MRLRELADLSVIEFASGNYHPGPARALNWVLDQDVMTMAATVVAIGLAVFYMYGHGERSRLFALGAAAKKGDEAKLRELLGAADGDGSGDGDVYILGGAKSKSKPGSKLDVNRMIDSEHGYTALHFAAESGHAACLKLLLERGGDVKATSKSDMTALHYAAWKGHAACLEVLLKGGSDVKATAGYERTALHYAAEKGHAACLEVLLKGGSDVMATNENRSTALHRAARNGHADCVKVLLDSGSDATFRDRALDGKTAMDYAQYKGHAACVALLKEAIDKAALVTSAPSL